MQVTVVPGLYDRQTSRVIKAIDVALFAYSQIMEDYMDRHQNQTH